MAGAQAYYGLQFGWGRLTPTARVELRDRRIDGTHQSMWYADRGDLVYRLPLAGFDGRAVTMSLGLEAAIHGLRLRLEYGTAGSALKTNDGQSIQVQVRGEF